MARLFDQLTIFGGNSNPQLTLEICDYLGMPSGRAEVFKFSNDNTFVRIGESVRDHDVFVVQSFANPINDSIMELLIMIDTLKRASAGRITAVIPYFGYGRTDKKDQPRVPITARSGGEAHWDSWSRPCTFDRSACWPDPGVFRYSRWMN